MSFSNDFFFLEHLHEKQLHLQVHFFSCCALTVRKRFPTPCNEVKTAIILSKMRLRERINVGRRACDIQGGIGIIGRITAWHLTPCVLLCRILSHFPLRVSSNGVSVAHTKVLREVGSTQHGKVEEEVGGNFFAHKTIEDGLKGGHTALLFRREKKSEFFCLTEWQRLNNLWRIYEKTRPLPLICCTKVPTPIPQGEWDGTGRGKKERKGQHGAPSGRLRKAFRIEHILFVH